MRQVPLAPAVGAALSLLLGLIFVFVWAPHPWGWHGIDQYHELARGLARGEPFATTDVPWGYAYFVAAFYFLFGDHAWIPVTAQVVANATIPVMLYALARPLTSERVAAIAALLVGAFSFNTVYASTESSDSMCTVIFIASLLLFANGARQERWLAFAVSGLLSGTVPQFRPNMILFPLVLALGYGVYTRGKSRATVHIAVFLSCVALALAPWVIRNYRLTGAILPTSTHGGVQLWYGTLQVGPYLESRAYNPRSIFEAPPFDYTSIAHQPIVITTEPTACGAGHAFGGRGGEPRTNVELIYRTNRHPRPVRVLPLRDRDGRVRFEIPGQPPQTTVYYHFEAQWIGQGGGILRQTTPVDAAVAPLVYFVDDAHLTDMDRDGDMLDVFDVIRLIRHLAWQDTSTAAAVDVDNSGGIDENDLKHAVVRLLGDDASQEKVFGARVIESSADVATLNLADGSTLSLPKRWSGRVTDLDVRGTLAGSLVSAHRRLREDTSHASPNERCTVWDIEVNEVFYRREPHWMRRYIALAADNISRDPWAFAAASAYRMGRLFIVRGSTDRKTTQQFERSAFVYLAGTIASAVYVLVFLIGVAIAWRRKSPALVLLVPIVYVPVTICFVLTNMRYTITVQPLMFVFVAVALASASAIWFPEARSYSRVGRLAGETGGRTPAR